MLNGFLVLPALYLLIGTVVWKQWFEPEFFEMMEDGDEPGVQELARQMRTLAESHGGKRVYLLLSGLAIFSWPLYVYQELTHRLRKSRGKGRE